MLALLLAAALMLPALSGAATKRGTAGPDTLNGTGAADTLSGLGAADTLNGRGGPDKLSGGPGPDKLTGGPAADRLLGDAGNDRLLARDGSADTVNCGSGSGDVAVVDASDKVAGNCERVEAPVLDQPPAPVPAPRVDTPAEPEGPGKEEPEKEEPGEEDPEVEYEERPLAMFPSGHGWTGVNGKFQDAGPPFDVNGTRSFRVGSMGVGTTAIATSPELEKVNLKQAHVTVQGQVSLSNRLQTVKLRLASDDIATDYAEATVWQEDFDPIVLGSTFEFQSLARGDFAVTGSVDWSKINRAQLLVTDNGTGETAFYVAGIYAVPDDQQKATISFAFDDGDASTYTRALKKLSTYRYPASAYIIADTVGTPGFLTLEQLHQLRDLHHWEIGGHSLTIASHNLPNGLDELNEPQLKNEMNGLRDWLYENGFSRASFAYPKGAAAPRVRHYVQRDYCAGRVTAKGPETLPPRDEYILRGWSINGLEQDQADVEDVVDKAVADGTWAILSFHDIVGGTPGASTDFNDDEFEAVVNYVHALQKQGKLKVRTVGDAVAPHCAD